MRQAVAGIMALAYLSENGSWREAPVHAATAAEFIGQRIIITDLVGIVVVDTSGERIGQTFNGDVGWQRTPIDDEAMRSISGRTTIGFGPGRPGAVSFVRSRP